MLTGETGHEAAEVAQEGDSWHEQLEENQQSPGVPARRNGEQTQHENTYTYVHTHVHTDIALHSPHSLYS